MTRSDDFAHRYGPWALVTGASSGIGEEMAKQLAARGLSLLLVARRVDRLRKLGEGLTAAHGVQTRAVELDLARHDFYDDLSPALDELDVGLAILNAGFGDKGKFVDASLDEHLRMLNVNCRSTLVLAHHMGNRLRKRGRGGIIITSSTAAFQGTPFTSHYAATKGWGLQLAEGLSYELRPDGVDVLALCPGPTDTEGPRRTGVDPTKVPVKLMSVEPVVRAALDGLGRVPVVIPGALNRFLAALTAFVPRRMATAIAGKMIARVIGD